MNLAKFSIEKTRIALTVLCTIIIMGVVLYFSLPRDSMPPYTVRVANIVTSFPGAGPDRVEQLVTDIVEKTTQEIPELDELNSTSRTGLSVVTVELKDEVRPEDLQMVWDRLRRKLDDIEDLPEGVKPHLDDDGIGDVFGIVIGLTTDGFSYAEMKEYADDIKDELIKLPDAAKVELGGVQEERVFVEFDNARLKEYDLSANKLQKIIASTNIISSGGKINLEDERIILEPTGNFNSAQDIREMLVPLGDGADPIMLGDITTITQSYIDPPKQKVRVNGLDAITLHINLKDGKNIIKLGQDVDRVVNKWQQVLPVGLEMSRLASLDHYIDKKISDFVVNLIQSVVIVLAVMILFLSFQTGSIIASLIPIVVIMTLMVMGVMNIGLNQVTLAALIMALGMMVDNAIVVAETIMVKIEQGKSKVDAAIQACGELFTPLLISTLTTSAAFLSFYLAQSIMGDIVGPIFVVISIALLSSWLIALSITTFFCVLFLRDQDNAAKEPSAIDRLIDACKKQYVDIILWALRYRTKVLLGTLGLFVVALLGFTQVPFVFFPDSDRNLITVDINLPEGTRIERTMDVVGQVEDFIAQNLLVTSERPDGILDWSSYIGEGPESYDQGYTPDEANSNYAHMLVNTSDATLNNDMIASLDKFCFENFPNADVKVSALASGGSGTPIEIKISGDDPDQLTLIGDQVRKKLTTLAGTKNVKDDWGPKIKKLIIDIDQNRAQKAGVTSQDIAISLQTILDGFQTGEYREDNKLIPILMRSDGSQQQTLTALETLNVFAQNSGKSVPLLQVANIVPTWQYAKIRRYNILRTINVSSELRADGNASEITSTMRQWLDESSQNWPDNYRYEFGGDAKNTADNMGAVFTYLPLSAFIIILLLIIQFNSVRKMTMVVLTIPLALIGVAVGLLLFHQPFGFMPFLGVISLAGIVINNAIVLIDRMEIEVKDYQRTPQDAVIVACLQRFRPILLATCTTILGLVPLYLSGGAMWEGMAVCIMVGLMFGTMITLVFLPTMYSFMFRISYQNYQFDRDLVNS